MIQISHIVSTDLLNLIDGRPFYMCLANIASKNEQYCQFYKEQVEKGNFVLLDNGCAEADQMTLDVMWEVIKKINPTEVILNDSLLNCDETLQKSEQALQFYKERGYKGQIMFVPQGEDFREWIRCYETFTKRHNDINTIGVSKFNTSGWKRSDARYICCDYIRGEYPIHLLGCHKNIKEVKQIANELKNIRSNDTAIAYIYAKDGKRINEGDRPNQYINFIKSELNEDQKKLLIENIKQFDEFVQEQ